MSKQQRAILVWILDNGEPLQDAIKGQTMFWHPFVTYEDDGSGVWIAGFKDSERPAFGHERHDARRDFFWSRKHLVQSDSERASVARSVSRLRDRGLLDRWKGNNAWSGQGRGHAYLYLILTQEGLDLAESLKATVSNSVAAGDANR